MACFEITAGPLDYFDPSGIAKDVLKLQRSTFAADATRHFCFVLGASGEDSHISDIVDNKGWLIPPWTRTEVEKIDFPEVEADIIRAFGRTIITKGSAPDG